MQPDLSAVGMDLTALALPIFLGGVAMAVLLLGLFVKKEQAGALAWLSLLGLAAGVMVTLLTRGGNASPAGRMVVVDDFYLFFAILSLAAAALAVLLSVSYLDRTGLMHAEYYGLIIFGAAGMVVMAAATNLIVLVVGLELLSLSLYVLAGFARTRLSSEEAALKYFLLGSFALGLLLYGSALIYGATGSLNYEAIGKALQGEQPGNAMLLIGLGLLLAGFAFKLALAPFHMWVPDVYEGAPSPVTAFMAVGTKAIVFAALLRLLTTAFPSVMAEWAALLSGLAVLTMIVGNLAAVVQSNIKRLLAYSAIAHAGYILMAVIGAGKLGSDAVLFYLAAYTVTNFGAFAVLVAVGEGREEKLSLEDYAGLAGRNPWLAAAMTLFMLSLAGVPLTAGFLGKLYVFSAAVQGGYLWLAAIGVATSVVAMYYYLKVVVAMYMRSPAEAAPVRKPTASMVAVVAIAAFFTLQLGVIPGLFMNLSQLPGLQALGM